MSAFALSEVPTVNKINQKTIFIGTSAPASPQDGQEWLDTSVNPYVIKKYHASAAAWRIIEVPTKKVKMPAAVSADYATPAGIATASSENSGISGTAWYDHTVGGIGYDIGSATNLRAGQKITTVAIGSNKVSRVRYQLKKTGAPTGTATLYMRKVSDDSIVQTIGTIDVSTLTATYTSYDFDLVSPVNPTYDIRLSLEYSGGDGSNYITLHVRDADGIANGNISRYFSGSWTDDGGRDAWIQVFGLSSPATYAASKAKDDDNATYWQPSPISEALAYVYFDLSSLQLVSGCRIYWLAASEIPGSFNIDVSEDAITWTNVKAITTAQTPNMWNEYSWNTKRSRYVRIQAVSYGSATTIKVAEFDFYATITDRALADHGHGDQV